jgi:RNA polymerase sigma factor (sigma-70 family)
VINPASSFPPTRLTLVQRIGSDDVGIRTSAFDALATAYWKPIYKYVRVQWRLDTGAAEDMTQAFLTAAYEKRFLERFDPAKARFRTFLRLCIDRFVQNQSRDAGRLKRGGRQLHVPLDFETAEGELRQHEAAVPADVDAFFHQEIVRALFARVVDRIRAACRHDGRDAWFDLFERYDLQPSDEVSYASLAQELGLTTTQVTNRLAAVRRRFREAVLDELRDMTTTDEEFRSEARELLGVEV